MTDTFAKEVRERFQHAYEADKDNRDEALKDLEFESGKLWDDQVRQYREQQGIARYGFPLPCLTINDLPQKTAQVIGDRQANATSIKILPKEDGDKDVATIRSELIRSIELQSKAERAYMMAFKPAVSAGVGFFRVDMDYANEDVFERDLFIRGIPNSMSVVMDELAADPTGRDAAFAFVNDMTRESDYERKFPDAAKAELFDREAVTAGWRDGNHVRVAEYFQMIEKPRTLAMMQDGKVIDVTDKPKEGWLPLAAKKADGVTPIVREKAMCKYVKSCMTNGVEQLTDFTELRLHRLPIIRVMGREIWVGEKRVRFGLVRFARDPAMLRTYWRSVIAEKLMLASRANFVAEAKAVKGRERDWVNTQVYNDGAQAPVPVTQNDLAAMMNEAQMCAQDMKDVTGLHDASLGMKSNETSGVAIQRRQHEGDIATIEYHSNMNAAMQEAGEVLNALIPTVYDTARTIRTVGEDDAIKLVRINDPLDPESVDLSRGRYDVTVSTGPAYMTKRQEAATSMMEAVQASSGRLFDVAGDLIAKAQDWPGADTIAERLKRAMPPELLGEEDKGQDDPEEAAAKQAAAQEAQQMQQMAQQLQMRTARAQLAKAEAEARKAEAEARKAEAEAKDAAEGITAARTAAHSAETNRLKLAKDFGLTPEQSAIVAPLITQAVMQALGSPDILPGELRQEISESAFDQAAGQQDREAMAAEAAMQPDPQVNPTEGM